MVFRIRDHKAGYFCGGVRWGGGVGWLASKLGGWNTMWWFQSFLFSPLLGEIIQFDLRIFFRWVGSTTNYFSSVRVDFDVATLSIWIGLDIYFFRKKYVYLSLVSIHRNTMRGYTQSHTPWKFNSSPLKIGWNPKGNHPERMTPNILWNLHTWAIQGPFFEQNLVESRWHKDIQQTLKHETGWWPTVVSSFYRSFRREM